jgi:hypothetical protein
MLDRNVISPRQPRRWCSLTEFGYFRNPPPPHGRQSRANEISKVNTAASCMQPGDIEQENAGDKAGWDVLVLGLAEWRLSTRGV